MLLHACIRDNHITLLKSLLSKASRTQLGVTEEGSSPLHLAVFLNSLPAVQALLDAGADPWLSDDTWYYDDWPPCRTPMLMAMSHGYREIVSCIWHHPAWTFLASTKADNCLRNAVCAGDPGILKDFLTWETDWSQSLLDDVLNMAAQTWNASALRVIIHGVPFPYGQTALTRALTSAVSKRVTHEGFPASPVFEMGCLDQALAIEELIKAGADPDLSIYKGHTPLYLVAHVRESIFGLRALLENGSNPNLILWDGFTVLHMLLSAIKWFPRRIKSENIHEAAIRLLLQHGALP
jgi:ankyrin repeat protein